MDNGQLTGVYPMIPATDSRRTLDDVLAAHATMLLATVEGGSPHLTETPFAAQDEGNALTLVYTVREDSSALAALRRRTGVAFTVGTPGDAVWLEGTGRAVIVHDAHVAADYLAALVARSSGTTMSAATTRVVRIVPETITVATRQGADIVAQPVTFAPAAGRWGYPGGTFNQRFQRFAEVTRADVAPVMAMPVAIGAALAWERGGKFKPLSFAFTLIGAVAAHLAANVTNDIFDFRSGADERARAMAATDGTLDTSSGALTGGAFSERQANLVAVGLWATALLCGAGVARRSGPGIVALAGAGFALGTLYVAPPLAYGYIGHGLGEAGILASFGVLPVLGSYYAQTGRFDWQPLLAALPPGLFTTDVLFNHHFFHWRSDKAVGKMTPVAVLGEEKAGEYSRGVLIASCVAILAGVVARVYPSTALSGLAATASVLEKLDQLGAGGKEQAFYGNLMDRTVKGSSRMGLYLIISLVVSGIWKRLRNRSASGSDCAIAAARNGRVA